MNNRNRILVALMLFLFAATTVSATQLGINYYHESMVSAAWQVPYINIGENQVRQDLDHIKEVSDHIKFYMNPYVDANAPWMDFLLAEAEQRGYYTVVNMMVDDRPMESWNWNDYRNRVLSLCSRYNGKADELLVGNEIILHGSMDKYEVRSKVEPLIKDCEARFSGRVTYEAFWYEKEAWFGYNKPLYFMQYEKLSSFETNVREMQSRFGANAYIGEWGEDSIDEGNEKDDWWQRVEIEKRWNIISSTSTPVAYIFTYREPSWNGFGIIRPDGLERPVWDYLKSLGDGSGSSSCTASTEVCDGRDNDCDGQIDESNVCAEPEPTTSEPSTSHSDGIGALQATCTSSANCWVKSDSTSGVCRTVTYGTDRGDIKVYGCEKSGGYVELYRQQQPSGVSYSACLANGCVTNNNGFARFIPDASSVEQSTEPAQSTSTGLEDLPVTCEASGCSKTRDDFNGACRDLDFASSYGTIKVRACEKDNALVEVYVYQKPSNSDFRICVGQACVTDGGGFAKTYLDEESSSSQDTTVQPVQQEPTTEYTVSTLPVRSEPAGTKVKDSTSGVCRSIQYQTSEGFIEAQICDKGSTFEMYLKTLGAKPAICVENHCVGNGYSGFASWS